MLELIKVGTGIAGNFVPPLASFKVVEFIGSVQQTVESVTSKIDYSLECIDKQVTRVEAFSPLGSIDTQATSTNQDLTRYLRNVDGVEGVELRQLESFLKISAEDNLLGNMYRMTTKDGYVKWVCCDHYRVGYKEKNTQKLRDLIKLNRGEFDEQLRKVAIWLGSSFAASEFYDTIGKAKGVLDLNVTFGWDQEFTDFVELKHMISKSKIISIRATLHQDTGPRIDVHLNGRRRYDPIFEAMCFPFLKSFEVVNAPNDFFKRSSPLSNKVDLSHLRHLKIDQVDFLDADITKLKSLVAQAPNLSSLILETDPQRFLPVLSSISGPFIVLPETAWNPISPFPFNSLRLYFICECGKLTSHEGYGLTRPYEFFFKYGSFLKVTLEMIESRASVASKAVSSKALDSLDSTQFTIDSVPSNVIHHIDMAHSFLNVVMSSEYFHDIDFDNDTRELHHNPDSTERMGGVDQFRLYSFLQSDCSDTLQGGLYRMATKDGHVKWVCHDHYIAFYHEVHLQKIHDVVNLAAGEFDERLGRIEITLNSRSSTAEFYDAVSQTMNVFDLCMTLAWDQEYTDFVKFRDMVLKSKIMSIRLVLHPETGPSIFDGRRRYDPIFEAMQLPSIKSFELVNSPRDLFKRSSLLPKVDLSNLSHLRIDPVDFTDTDMIKFKLMVSRAPNLSSLSLTTAPKRLSVLISLFAEYRKTCPAFFRNLSLCFNAAVTKEQREKKAK
ncbi:hypothetical protein BGZ98_004959 [Dissophora globulifera]|nr:hypothetical protein BGZ98_004959 [Dissophora globulifera]